MAYYSTVWFWLIIVGVILLIAGIIWYFVAGTTATSTTKTFIYALIAFGALLLLIGIIFAIFDSDTPATVVTPTVINAVTPAATTTTTEVTRQTTAPVLPAAQPMQTITSVSRTEPLPVTVPVIRENAPTYVERQVISAAPQQVTQYAVPQAAPQIAVSQPQYLVTQPPVQQSYLAPQQQYLLPQQPLQQSYLAPQQQYLLPQQQLLSSTQPQYYVPGLTTPTFVR